MKTLPLLTICAAFLVAAALPNAHGQTSNNKPPGKMSFQGFLTDSAGAPLGAGAPTNVTVFFRLYNKMTGSAPADKIWAEQQVVTIDKGHFSVLLGEGSATGSGEDPAPSDNLSGFFVGQDASDRFLGIQVSGQQEIAPRIQFLPAPYAFLAQNANNVLAPSGGAAIVTKGTGDVGIGTANPEQKLHVVGTALVTGNLKANNIVIGDVGHGASWAGVAHADSANANGYGFLQNSSGAATFLNAKAGAASTIEFRFGNEQKMVMNGSGNLSLAGAVTAGSFNGTHNGNGGGITGLNANNINAGTLNSDRLPGTISQNRTFTGTLGIWGGNAIEFGQGLSKEVNNGKIGYQTFSSGLDIVGAGPTVAERRVYFHAQGGTTYNGPIGIYGGTGAAPLYVASYTWRGLHGSPDGFHSNGGFNNNGHGYGLGTANGGSFPISIAAEQWIEATGFVANSDLRIKEIISRTDSAKDLETIQKLQVTDYRHIDKVQSGGQVHKGLIAQEVQEIIPAAVSASRKSIPSIYEKAQNFQHEEAAKELKVELGKAHELKVGDSVRLVVDDEAKDFKITSTANESSFVVSDVTKAPAVVFVYGKVVDDFLSVDYDRVFTTGIGAIQELARQVESLKAREARIAVLEEKAGRVESLEKKVAELENLVTRMAALMNESRPRVQSAPVDPSAPAIVPVAAKVQVAGR